MIEFHDRLLFISAQIAPDPLYPVIHRARDLRAGQHPSQSPPCPGPPHLHYQMEVPDDLEPYIRDKYRTERLKKLNNNRIK